mgnify:CR=1 FL=1
MPINTPLIKNNRFEILRTENKNTFGQRRTRSSPSLNRAHHNNVIDGQSLRRINSARFETRTHKKYKAPPVGGALTFKTLPILIMLFV